MNKKGQGFSLIKSVVLVIVVIILIVGVLWAATGNWKKTTGNLTQCSGMGYVNGQCIPETTPCTIKIANLGCPSDKPECCFDNTQQSGGSGAANPSDKSNSGLSGSDTGSGSSASSSAGNQVDPNAMIFCVCFGGGGEYFGVKQFANASECTNSCTKTSNFCNGEDPVGNSLTVTCASMTFLTQNKYICSYYYKNQGSSDLNLARKCYSNVKSCTDNLQASSGTEVGPCTHCMVDLSGDCKNYPAAS